MKFEGKFLQNTRKKYIHTHALSSIQYRLQNLTEKHELLFLFQLHLLSNNSVWTYTRRQNLFTTPRHSQKFDFLSNSQKHIGNLDSMWMPIHSQV